MDQKADPFVPEAMVLLDMILGIGEQVAQTIVSEMGVDMTRLLQ